MASSFLFLFFVSGFASRAPKTSMLSFINMHQILWILQFTHGYQIDLVPADISTKPDFYGYDPAEAYEYRPSNTMPLVSIFGFPSYRTLTYSTDFLSLSAFNWSQGTGVKNNV
ncbi:uncharacterized protein F4812DRAFT_455021 [Daldinia caldariorum]|uniref:uncharacterized protein n=1 Tax=Daldinia caldariorum TaxID=326644 RepID=UPI00200854F5|nr:uncharacterized protein F4812DRAFT_455021 [Daldinia caldariorum]KAI1473206.1 hypothetical protein F4812DRAFT_455021 [Daldinia caldariorum]